MDIIIAMLVGFVLGTTSGIIALFISENDNSDNLDEYEYEIVLDTDIPFEPCYYCVWNSEDGCNISKEVLKGE